MLRVGLIELKSLLVCVLFSIRSLLGIISGRAGNRGSKGDVMGINIERALTIQGWMSPTELTYLAECASKSKNIVEIGVYKGRSTCALAENTQGTVHSVDIWSECGTDGWFYDVFRANTERYSNVIPVNRASIYAAREFAAANMKFDFIFIDAAHDKYNFRQDILAWRPLLTDGGIFAGHDYDFVHHPDVKPIVDEMVSNIRIIDTIWTTEA
jgi:predicted O-methyltransferase YrrM